MKKTLSILLTVILLLSCVSCTVTAANTSDDITTTSLTADDTISQLTLFGYQFNDDGFAYQQRENGTIEIGGYIGTEENLVFPDTINDIPVTMVRLMYSSDELKSRVKAITIPESVTNMEFLNTYQFDNLETVYFNAINCYETAVNCSKAFANHPKIDTIYIGDKVEIIPQGLCQETCITHIELPDSLREIKPNAFMRCNYLEQIVIPDHVTVLGEKAFYGCDRLKNAVIGDGVTDIGLKTFYYSNQLESVSFGAGVENIGESAFELCSVLKMIDTKNIKTIGQYAFKKCSALEHAELREGLTEIGESAFVDCTEMTEATLPDTLTDLGSYAFLNCYKLTSVVIPDGVTTVPSMCFAYCKSAAEVIVPETVSYIGKWAFLDTAWYNSQPDGEIYINNILYTYKGEMPESYVCEVKKGTESISPSAFESQSNLVGVSIPEGVQSVGQFAFVYCPELRSVSLPSSLFKIGIGAFGYVANPKNPSKYVKVDGFTVYGYIDSGAQKYAESGKFAFVPISETGDPLCLGDVDEDGDTSIVDATWIQRANVQMQIPIAEIVMLTCGDVDGDGEATVIDATLVQRYDSYLATPYPIGKPLT